MSQQSQINVACPKCGAKQKAKVYTSIDVTLEPKLRQQVVSMDVNKLKCKKCEQESTLETPFLYQDHQRDFMIQLASDEEFSEAKVEAAFEVLEGESQEEITTRRVRSYEDLIEKIRIFEGKLDDRVVEILKFQVKEQQPELKDAKFALVGMTKDQLGFFALTGEGVGRFELPMASYKELETALKEAGLPAREKEQWRVVDQGYATTTYASLNSPIQ